MSKDKKSWDIALAEKFKERDNPSPIGAVLGKILSPLPNISIELLNGYGVIDADKIYLSNAITNRLEIECTMKDFESQGNKASDCTITNLSTEGAGGDSGGDTNLSLSGHTGSYTASTAKKENKIKGKFILQTVFNLKEGMYVLVIPNVAEDKFFVVDVFNYAPEVSLEWQYYQK
nr:MAG TPA: Protein of unknown function (DUF2577) [Caudoviricetes sp.]